MQLSYLNYSYQMAERRKVTQARGRNWRQAAGGGRHMRVPRVVHPRDSNVAAGLHFGWWIHTLQTAKRSCFPRPLL